MLKTTLTLIALFTLSFIASGQAQQQESLDVRLTRIEESIKALNQRLDGMNQRIDDTNQRFEAGFDRQTNWAGNGGYCCDEWRRRLVRSSRASGQQKALRQAAAAG